MTSLNNNVHFSILDGDTRQPPSLSLESFSSQKAFAKSEHERLSTMETIMETITLV
jgi:hypothetical protein